MLFKKLENFNFYVILFFVFIFVHAVFLLHGSVLCADDVSYNFIIDGKIKLIWDYWYGTWVMHIINLFFYYIPYKLGINIQDWCASTGSIIKSSVITLIFIYFYKFLKTAKFRDFVSLSITAVLYFAFFILQSRIFYIDLAITTGFFRFLFPAFVYEIFLYYCLKLFQGQNKNIIFISILGMLTACSSEFICPLTLSTILILCVCDKKKQKKWFLVLAGTVMGLICLISSHGFQWNITYKLRNNVFGFRQIIGYIPSFSKLFIRKIIICYLPFYLIMIISSFAAFKINRGGLSYIKFSFIVLSALFISLFSFIVFGRTSYSNDFWLSHRDLYSIVDIVIFTVFIINISAAAEIMSKIPARKYAAIGIIIMCSIVYLFINSCITLRTGLENIRDLSYLRDKMRLFYIYKGIPSRLSQFAKFLMPYSYIMEKKVSPLVNKEIIHSAELENDVIEFMNKSYYPILYKIDTNMINPDIEFAENNTEAIEYYVRNGGSYTELDNRKYKFADLENKKFVLNENQ